MTEQPIQAPVAVVENPLLAKVKIPGRDFQLPSMGYLYQGELNGNVDQGELHVHPMNALAEIKMKNPDLLFSGQAFEEVIRECVPGVYQPMELYGKDVDAIMCFIRVVTYGNEFEINANHQCENGKDRTYTIDVQGIIDNMKLLDPSTLEDNYIITLENGQKVQLEPVRLRHVVDLLQSSTKNSGQAPTHEEVQNNLMSNLLNMIHSVDGITDKAQIAEWVKQVPATYINRIGDKMAAANNWGPNFEQQVKCPDCGEDFLVELPVNPVHFFSE